MRAFFYCIKYENISFYETRLLEPPQIAQESGMYMRIRKSSKPVKQLPAHRIELPAEKIKIKINVTRERRHEQYRRWKDSRQEQRF